MPRRRVLNDRDDAAGHEPGRSNGLPRPGCLDDLDQPTAGGDLDPPAGLRRLDLESANGPANVDEDLYPVTEHAPSVGTARTTPPTLTGQ